jgi:hypothetical protein
VLALAYASYQVSSQNPLLPARVLCLTSYSRAFHSEPHVSRAGCPQLQIYCSCTISCDMYLDCFSYRYLSGAHTGRIQLLPLVYFTIFAGLHDEIFLHSNRGERVR